MTTHDGNSLENRPKYLLDAQDYYKHSIDPQENFNKIEITFSHLFRYPSPIIGGISYGEALHRFLQSKDAIQDQVIEIGGGLGDTMHSFLSADVRSQIKECTMFDVSPAFSQCQETALSKFAHVQLNFVNGDCENIAESISDLDGLIICNGVIADLATYLVEPGDDLRNLLRGDKALEEFVRSQPESETYYLHLGALQFIKSLRDCLSSDSIVMISEYMATSLNQPSWFDNHYECGINFAQICRFAQSIGFTVEEYDVTDVVGFDTSTQLLSMDFFTMRDTMAISCPMSTRLWQTKDGFPVGAYTKDMVREKLSVTMSEDEASSVLGQLADYFHPIDSLRFDSKNPTTWNYRYLLLRPQK